MRNNTESKILLEALQSLRLFRICHLLTAQYISECQEILQAAELLNIVPLFYTVKA